MWILGDYRSSCRFLGFSFLVECFVPWFLFLLDFGVCNDCMLPFVLACSVGMFTGNACCFWRLGHSVELGKQGLEGMVCGIHKGCGQRGGKLRLVICFSSKDELVIRAKREMGEIICR